MKKFFLILSLMVMSVTFSFADSPLTSTDFYTAYLDVPIVKKAAEKRNVLTEEMMAYLHDDSNPLDVKMALINAVGWDFDRMSTFPDYMSYCTLHYPKERYNHPQDKIVTYQDVWEHASPDQLAVLVYLRAMAEYDNPARAYDFVEIAMGNPIDKQSFMLPMGLVIAQIALYLGDWGNIYPAMNYYLFSPETQDMRPEAIKIIMDYIDLYKEYADRP